MPIDRQMQGPRKALKPIGKGTDNRENTIALRRHMKETERLRTAQTSADLFAEDMAKVGRTAKMKAGQDSEKLRVELQRIRASLKETEYNPKDKKMLTGRVAAIQRELKKLAKVK